jgi:HK97 family phage major capsid protein
MKPLILLEQFFSLAGMSGLPVIFNSPFLSRDEIVDRIDELNQEAQAIRNKADAENRDLSFAESGRLDGIFAEFDRLEAQLNNKPGSRRISEPQQPMMQNSLPPRFNSMPGRQSSRSANDSTINNAVGRFIKSGGDISQMQNAMSVGSDADGGYAVVPLTTGINNILRNSNPMRGLLNVRTVNGAGSIEEIISADVSAASWIAETSARPATNTPGLKRVTARLDELYSLQSVTQRMIDDYSLGDLGAWLMDRLALGIAELESTTFATGAAAQATNPVGLINLTMSALGDASRTWGEVQKIASGSPAVLDDNAGDVLLETLYSLKPVHRQSSTWLMNSATAYAVMKMRDTVGNYVWSQDFSAGQPATLLGRPVVILESLPDIGAGALPLWLGNWREAFLVAEHPGLRLLPDPYSNRPYVDYYGYYRVGWALRDSNALKAVSIEA